MLYRVGELRRSQLLYSFGIGANIDLANLAVIVMGLDFWKQERMVEITEARLLAAVQRHIGKQVARLCAPPAVPSDQIKSPTEENARIGVPVNVFPTWLRCPACNRIAPYDSGLFELKSPYQPDQIRYVHANCGKGLTNKPPTAVPVRFVVACENGHLDDFPWLRFVHRGDNPCRGALELFQQGVSEGQLMVRCTQCEVSRPMADAFGLDAREILPRCRGYHPHLLQENTCRIKDNDDRLVPTPLKTMLLGATNSWFSVNLSVLSVPEQGASRLQQLVEDHWTLLAHATSPDILKAFRASGQLPAFAEFSDDELWRVIEARRNADEADDEVPDDLKLPEWQAFANPDPAHNNNDFRLTPTALPAGFESYFEQIVLVERLREVRALIGFTRISSPGEFGEEYELPNERRAPLSKESPRWIPATEVRGEGVFIRFQEAAVSAWCRQTANRALEQRFLEAHRQWRRQRHLTPESEAFPGIRYLLLHSFAHALMRQLALECGYNAASIRERIYSREPNESGGPMAGVLIYTAAADSEGTLGGLVVRGRPENLTRHLRHALEDMQLCSSDPLCAEHEPIQQHISLHGAACHACLFAPETSCERGNKYLDRRLLVPTFSDDAGPFFRPDELPDEAVVTADGPALPDGFEPVAAGVPVFTAEALADGWTAQPEPDAQLALSGAPDDSFVLRLDLPTLETRAAGGKPLTAGTWLLLQRTAPDDFDRHTPQLLLRRDGYFSASARPWTVGLPVARQAADGTAQLRVRYASTRSECAPETVELSQIVSLGRVIGLCHGGDWTAL